MVYDFSRHSSDHLVWLVLMLEVLMSWSIGVFFFLMIRPPPRSTQSRSSAASDVYKRQIQVWHFGRELTFIALTGETVVDYSLRFKAAYGWAVSYTHLRAHETPEHIVCRLLLETKKPHNQTVTRSRLPHNTNKLYTQRTYTSICSKTNSKT